MTLYEDLGVPPDATPEAIREAYRSLARQVHPDAQLDPALKEDAETRMKEINLIYDVLSDPEKRLRYDQSLAVTSTRGTALVVKPPPEVWEPPRRNHGNLIWYGATGICAVFFIWLATREPEYGPSNYPPSAIVEAGASTSIPQQKARAPESVLERAAAAILPKSREEKQREDEAAWLRAQLNQANAERDRLSKELEASPQAMAETRTPRPFAPPPAAATQRKTGTIAEVTPAQISVSGHMAQVNLPQTGLPPVAAPAPVVTPAAPAVVPQPPANVPMRQEPIPMVNPAPSPVAKPAPAVAAAPAPAAPVAMSPERKLVGAWAYAAPKTENKNKALFPPEFIEASISEDNGRVRGQYHAKFRVPDDKIAPNVDFRFEGRATGPGGDFAWTGPGGAKGQLRIRLVSDSAMEVVWVATRMGSLGLASGTAVLVKRN